MGVDKDWVPPIAMMTILGDTHTQAALPPPTAPFNSNDNVVLSPFSAFYAGAITDHIGTFAQVTYNAPPPGGFSDPFGRTWTWDNACVGFPLRRVNNCTNAGCEDHHRRRICSPCCRCRRLYIH